MLKHQLCAGIVSVELWCPRIVSPLLRRTAMIEFGTENTVCGKFPPYIISCKELIGEGEPLNTLVIEIGVENGGEYRITFESYMLHLTRNESYTFWDEYEVRKGQYFIKFEKSRMLDMLDTLIIHTEDHSWPGVGKHFGIYACDHVIDVISANDPVIEKIE